jgi:hypothetical protein
MICTPAVVYLVLATISFIFMMSQKFNLFAMFTKVIIIALWTWFLNFLCTKGYTSISWFLVFLPIIIFIFLMLFMFHIFNSIKENFEAKKDDDRNKLHHNVHNDLHHMRHNVHHPTTH